MPGAYMRTSPTSRFPTRLCSLSHSFFFFNDTATTEIYTLSLHDALPISPLAGKYTFEHADLSVFNSIAGILNSTGQFEGTLDTIRAWGQASVADFRLKAAGNPVPLITSFEVRVDGTNGNTILSPVNATLGSTHFTTSGAVIKREKRARRTISLDVSMPDGD